jgi:hypothetical protein
VLVNHRFLLAFFLIYGYVQFASANDKAASTVHNKKNRYWDDDTNTEISYERYQAKQQALIKRYIPKQFGKSIVLASTGICLTLSGFAHTCNMPKILLIAQSITILALGSYTIRYTIQYIDCQLFSRCFRK